MGRLKVLVAVGTRPEAIKLAPVIAALRRRRDFEVIVCATAQHRELLDKTLRVFGIRPEVDLDLMRPGQSHAGVLRLSRAAVGRELRRCRPDLVLVQGDTSGALGAALAAQDAGILVGHVEAGLRSFDRRHPCPEESNRVRIDQVAQLWFAPTQRARANLRREDLGPEGIFVTGNTGIDALHWALRRAGPLRMRLPLKRIIVVTLHRRESLGRTLEGVMKAIGEAAGRLPGWTWVFPVHLNPRVRRAARLLRGNPDIRMIPPLGYLDFVSLMKRADFIVTDSGGIQEEAPTLKKPVLVVRRKTERPELLERGGKLAGTSRRGLVRELIALAKGARPPAAAKNPFGDGRAGERIAAALTAWAKSGRIKR